ncbi:hypothetical protein BC829DRAFT_447575 [Chytridium lagenaria]|nr:hypothetical protein BC829DRAFT_447575 [Chytridium lagenaria]
MSPATIQLLRSLILNDTPLDAVKSAIEAGVDLNFKATGEELLSKEELESLKTPPSSPTTSSAGPPVSTASTSSNTSTPSSTSPVTTKTPSSNPPSATTSPSSTTSSPSPLLPLLPYNHPRHLPITESAMHGHVKVVTALLQAGMDPNQFNGMPVLRACDGNPVSLDVLRVLFEAGARVNPQDDPVRIAVEREDVGLVKLLLEFKADFFEVTGMVDQKGNVELARLIVMGGSGYDLNEGTPKEIREVVEAVRAANK